jgi:hypothetical protein
MYSQYVDARNSKLSHVACSVDVGRSPTLVIGETTVVEFHASILN